MSRCLTHLGEIEEAGAQAKRAAELSPEIAEAHLGFNDLLSKIDDPEIFASHLRTAELLMRENENRKEEALAELREAIRLEPDNPQNHLILALAYGDDKIDEAAAELREVMRLEPYDVNAHQMLSRFLESQGDVAGAVTEMLAAVEFGPRDEEAHLGLIDLYKTTGDT